MMTLVFGGKGDARLGDVLRAAVADGAGPLLFVYAIGQPSRDEVAATGVVAVFDHYLTEFILPERGDALRALDDAIAAYGAERVIVFADRSYSVDLIMRARMRVARVDVVPEVLR